MLNENLMSLILEMRPELHLYLALRESLDIASWNLGGAKESTSHSAWGDVAMATHPEEVDLNLKFVMESLKSASPPQFREEQSCWHIILPC
jgi:hypothetical protein